ncbi:MAG: phosphoribosyltransferase family protein [Paracoccaceae bacterium]|nr:phosphoribosyltransferase family protein [Paracoccaceae bacterium]
MQGFSNRIVAGQALAEALLEKEYADPVVLALPRGGVPVGLEVARVLGAPLDLVMVRKIGVPYQPELAAAAVVNGAHPELVVNEDIAAHAGLSRKELDGLADVQLKEIKRRRQIYLKGRVQVPVEGRTAILVDDGIATGATTRAALKAVRRRNPAKLVLAVPVAPADTLDALRDDVDEIVCLVTPHFFYAIGAHYVDFNQVPDEEVVRLLEDADRALSVRAMKPGEGELPEN